MRYPPVFASGTALSAAFSVLTRLPHGLGRPRRKRLRLGAGQSRAARVCPAEDHRHCRTRTLVELVFVTGCAEQEMDRGQASTFGPSRLCCCCFASTGGARCLSRTQLPVAWSASHVRSGQVSPPRHKAGLGETLILTSAEQVSVLWPQPTDHFALPTPKCRVMGPWRRMCLPGGRCLIRRVGLGQATAARRRPQAHCLAPGRATLPAESRSGSGRRRLSFL